MTIEFAGCTKKPPINHCKISSNKENENRGLPLVGAISFAC